MSPNAIKIMNDNSFQLSNLNGNGFPLNQAQANSLGISIEELQDAANELVSNYKAEFVTNSHNAIKRI